MTAEIERPLGTEERLRTAPVPLRRHRRWQLAGVLVAGAVLAALGIAVAQRMAAVPTGLVAVAPAAEPQRLTARGQVRPVAQARVGTLTGGVVSRLVIEPGDSVNDNQEMARLRGPTGTEIVTAPFHGTVTAVLVRLGDTVAPGAAIATIGDLSRLQVETTDVDEFVIAHVERGQPAVVLIEALDRELPGRVRTVALEPTMNLTGDEHYPVAIDLLEAPAKLRPGMTARVRFAE